MQKLYGMKIDQFHKELKRIIGIYATRCNSIYMAVKAVSTTMGPYSRVFWQAKIELAKCAGLPAISDSFYGCPVKVDITLI